MKAHSSGARDSRGFPATNSVSRNAQTRCLQGPQGRTVSGSEGFRSSPEPPTAFRETRKQDVCKARRAARFPGARDSRGFPATNSVSRNAQTGCSSGPKGRTVSGSEGFRSSPEPPTAFRETRKQDVCKARRAARFPGVRDSGAVPSHQQRFEKRTNTRFARPPGPHGFRELGIHEDSRRPTAFREMRKHDVCKARRAALGPGGKDTEVICHQGTLKKTFHAH